MGKKKYTFIVMVLFIFSILAAPVYAQDTQDDDEMVQTTAEPTEDNAAKTNSLKARSERLKQYKEKRTERLAVFQQQRITQRCASAQGKIASLRARVNAVKANREKVYKEIGDKLDTLILKLQAAEVDTTELETARTDMSAELKTLTENLATYEMVLTDIEEMDCELDPEAFKGALDEARNTRQSLQDDARAFRRFVQKELRSILVELRKDLAAKAGGDTEPVETEIENETTE
jgi:hypothetical protein